ncbi:hypothetical protein O3M35_001085 [Rhynocoris fuscipes]|uniref:CHK kinase-like domain-containing protein n=1 Tax=Rhynocoris fuscipes TaxID=488301 RepID=A0AAW1DRI6_9HEMI
MALNKENDMENERCVWLETVINKQLNDKSIARVIGIDEKQAVPEGNNYTSIITRAKLHAILRNGEKSKINVIIKNEHVDEKKIQVLEVIPTFKTEIMAYSNILHKCELLMNEYDDQNEKLWCQLIGYRPNNLIVFEDLKVKNYVLTDRSKMLDLNHSSLVLHNLGRLHGLCFVLIKKGLLSKSDTPPFYAETDFQVIKNFYEGSMKQLGLTIEKYWPSEWKEIGKRIYKQHEVVSGKIKKLVTTPPDDCFITLCHGDVWCTNMLFKYCPYDSSYPISHKFLDFQTIHINSSVFDVMHFISSSVQPDVRRRHFDKLLNIYVNSLKSTLAIYGMEDCSPTIDQINKELERIEYYGLVITLIMLPIVVAEGTDAFNMEELNIDGDPLEAFNPQNYKNERYKSAVQPELKAWFKKGLF